MVFKNTDWIIYEDEFRGPNKEQRVLGAAVYIPGGIFLPNIVGLSADPFVLFHLKQAFVFSGMFIIIWILPFGWSFSLGLLLYLILSGIHAYQAYKWEIYRLWIFQSFFPVESTVAALSKSAHPKNPDGTNVPQEDTPKQ